MCSATSLTKKDLLTAEYFFAKVAFELQQEFDHRGQVGELIKYMVIFANSAADWDYAAWYKRREIAHLVGGMP